MRCRPGGMQTGLPSTRPPARRPPARPPARRPTCPPACPVAHLPARLPVAPTCPAPPAPGAPRRLCGGAAGRLLCGTRHDQRAAGPPPGAAVPHGRHPGPGGLVDGAQRLAGERQRRVQGRRGWCGVGLRATPAARGVGWPARPAPCLPLRSCPVPVPPPKLLPRCPSPPRPVHALPLYLSTCRRSQKRTRCRGCPPIAWPSTSSPPLPSSRPWCGRAGGRAAAWKWEWESSRGCWDAGGCVLRPAPRCARRRSALPLHLPPALPCQVWTTLSVAIPCLPTVAAGPEAAHAARLLGRLAHPVAAIIGITAMRCVLWGRVPGLWAVCLGGCRARQVMRHHPASPH